MWSWDRFVRPGGLDETVEEDVRVVAPPEGIPQFREVAQARGVRFFHVCGGEEKDYIVETNGGGCALFDYDSDGDLDLFLVNGSRFELMNAGPSERPRDALFRNDGSGRFTDVTADAGVGDPGWGCGCAVADYDADGDLDLFITNWGPDTLYRNNGDGTFTDVTEVARVGDPGWGASAAFGDVDRDGLVDLYVVNYLEFDLEKVPPRGRNPSCQYKGLPILCGPVGLPGAHDTLYHNNGDGTFTDVSEKAGIRSVRPSYGLGVAFLDFDSDGWADIYVTNDTNPNLLLHNLGDGTFRDVAYEAGVALNDNGSPQAGMGVDLADLRGVGREDIFVVNYENDSNTYYRNEGEGFFIEVTGAIGLSEPSFPFLGWSCVFFDPDLDGDQDIFIANGHVVPQVRDIPSSVGYRERNHLYLNDGEGRFREVGHQAGPGFEVIRSSRGAAVGDLDGDGDPDLVVSDIDDPPTVLENEGRPVNHWVAFRLVGTRSNRDGIGSWVAIRVEGRMQGRTVRSGSSFASHAELVARFGLGGASGVDGGEVVVRWPTGSTESYPVPAIDRVITLREGKGRP